MFCPVIFNQPRSTHQNLCTGNCRFRCINICTFMNYFLISLCNLHDQRNVAQSIRLNVDSAERKVLFSNSFYLRSAHYQCTRNAVFYFHSQLGLSADRVGVISLCHLCHLDFTYNSLNDPPSCGLKFVLRRNYVCSS